MRILVIGAGGQVGRLLVPLLVGGGAEVRGLVRREGQVEALERAGAEPFWGDLEGEFEGAFAGCQAVVFTAGSGASTGPDKTLTVDLWGALRAIDAAAAAGVDRFVMVSALKARDPAGGPPGLMPYLVAKHAADRVLEKSGLGYTIVRPGRLTDGPPTGRVALAPHLADRSGSVPRADVAAVIAALLTGSAAAEPRLSRRTFDLLTGPEAIGDALAGLAAAEALGGPAEGI